MPSSTPTARKIASKTVLYGALWTLIAYFCLQDAAGTTVDRVLIAVGLGLFHGSTSILLSNIATPLGKAWLGTYGICSAFILFLLFFHAAYLNAGGLIAADSMRALAQTNAGEALSYVKRVVTAPAWILMGSMLLILAAVLPLRRQPLRRRTFIAVIIAAASGSAVTIVVGTVVTTPIRTYIAEYREELRSFNELLEQRKLEPIAGAQSDFVGNIIVVIAESISRHQMSAYGYHRPTTPLLDARASSLITFRDVISSHSHTVQSIASALTSSGSTEQAKYFAADSVDILSLAAAAGFETHWLSNQNEFGVWDSAVTLLGRQTDNPRFLSTGLGKSFMRSSHDAELIPALDAALRPDGKTKRLVFLHLFTNHWPYCRNYPAGFRKFKGPMGPRFFGNAPETSDINCYDNGILYVDHLIEQIIQIGERQSEPTALVLLSDHGEAPLLGTGHESTAHSSYHIEIPFMVWGNGAYLAANREKIAAARSNAERPYSTARLYHSIAHLLDINHATVHSEDSVFSTKLIGKNRVSLNDSIRYDEWAPANDIRENALSNLRSLGQMRSTVWAHRVNTIGSLLEASRMFNGIELDVVFAGPKECFRVYHPPAPDTELSLEEMLRIAHSRPDLMLWLDWKNASADNIAGALHCLRDLDQRYRLANRTLVETGAEAVFPEIARIAELGLRHSYYMPTESLLECMKNCNSHELKLFAQSLRSLIVDGKFSAVSFDWRLAPFISEWFAAWASERGLALYSWDLTIDISHQQDAPKRIEQRLSTLPLQGLLVTYPSPFKS